MTDKKEHPSATQGNGTAELPHIKSSEVRGAESLAELAEKYAKTTREWAIAVHGRNEALSAKMKAEDLLDLRAREMAAAAVQDHAMSSTRRRKDANGIVE